MNGEGGAWRYYGQWVPLSLLESAIRALYCTTEMSAKQLDKKLCAKNEPHMPMFLHDTPHDRDQPPLSNGEHGKPDARSGHRPRGGARCPGEKPEIVAVGEMVEWRYMIMFPIFVDIPWYMSIRSCLSAPAISEVRRRACSAGRHIESNQQLHVCLQPHLRPSSYSPDMSYPVPSSSSYQTRERIGQGAVRGESQRQRYVSSCCAY